MAESTNTCPIHPNQATAEGLPCRACVAGQPPTAYKNPPPEGGYLKRPLVEITRMGPVVKVLKSLDSNVERLAKAVEQLIFEAYEYQSHKPEVDTSGPEPQVMYTDQDEHDIRDIVEAMKEE